MKLTTHIKLTPKSPLQADALRCTLGTANAACDAISRTAWWFTKIDGMTGLVTRIW